MSQSYQLWFTVKIQHHYFADGHNPLSCTPTQETSTIFKQNNILIKPLKNGFSVLAESEATIAPELNTKLKNLDKLSFAMQVNYPLFFNYTDIPFLHKGESFLFCNIINNPALQIETVADAAGNVEDFGILQIDTGNLNTRELSLTFNARKVFWQYAFIINSGTPEVNNMEVFGPADEKFQGPVEEISPDGQRAQIFTSPVSLPLMQQLTVHPRLMFGNKKQPLELKLPNVEVETLGIFSKGEHTGAYYCRSRINI